MPVNDILLFEKMLTLSTRYLIHKNEHRSYLEDLLQIKKETIKNHILQAAREEFINKGFKDASMRTIAGNAGVGLSNIYNYFKNKDEILNEVLSPLIMALDKILREHNDPEYISTDIFISKSYQLENINRFVNLITHYKEELSLLLFKSNGSRFENFRDTFADRHTLTGMQYLRRMKAKYPKINTDISSFFIHTVSSWWLSIIGEIVAHDLSAKEIERFVSEYMAFGTAGWKKLMGV
jgi:AcrR family transcriptional regulator